MTPLQKIPAGVRAALYWTGYVLGNVSNMLTVVWGIIAASSSVTAPPLGVLIAVAVLNLLTTQLNALAGANVSDPNAVIVSAPPAATVEAQVTFQQDHPKT